jgi:DNA-binding IclR family transcriptional regulator
MKSIRKATEVLRLLAEPPHEMSVADAARALGVTPSNASRILAELRDAELLDQDPATRRYRPGPLAMRLAAGFQHTTDLLACIQDSMPELIGRTTHTAWAGVLDGASVVVLRMQHGGFPIRMDLELGRRLPAHAAAMGKALLALLPDAEIRKRMLGQLEPVTPRSIVTVPALLADIERVRERGYAISDEELFLGIKSIAIAFSSDNAQEPVALSLSFPAGVVDAASERSLVTALLETGRAIGIRIGDRKWREDLELGAQGAR